MLKQQGFGQYCHTPQEGLIQVMLLIRDVLYRKRMPWSYFTYISVFGIYQQRSAIDAMTWLK